MIKIKTRFVLVLVLVLVPSAHAELTATVVPGYTFSSGERADTSKLNRLGLPTITITGTLSGTNAGISAGSINANMFSASVVDNDSIDFTNSSPQAIRIKSAGVTARTLATSIAGAGLAGGAGTALSVTVDDAGIGITNDVLTLKTNLSPSYLGVPSGAVVVGITNRGVAVDLTVFARMLATNQFTSAEYSISAGGIANAAHSLSVTPSVVTAVLVCKTSEGGYAVGDELRVEGLRDTSAGLQHFSYGGNSTNVWATLSTSTGGTSGNNKSTGAVFNLNLSNWRLKLYARP